MPLQFVIDGYNIIRHIQFTSIPKKHKDQRQALLEIIKNKRLTGSKNNKVTIVFDGYAKERQSLVLPENFNLVFSAEETADERIKKMLQKTDGPKNVVVVSDDREIRFFTKSAGCHALAVEEFLEKAQARPLKEPDKPELSYTQAHRINEELKKIWLK